MGRRRDRRRSISAASSAPLISTACGPARSGDVAAGRRPVDAAAVTIAASPPAIATSVKIRFQFIVATKIVARLCYDSPCTLFRLGLRSIPVLSCKLQSSSPLDSPLLASPASLSRRSMAAR